MKSLREQFIDWLETKPADEEYDWFDNHGCAIHQFLEAAGYPVECTGRQTWFDTDGRAHDIPDEMHLAADAAPNTFGALRSRMNQSCKPVRERLGV